MPRREPVSIVCVWNDEAVRRDCLDSSLQALLPTAPQTEYLPVDNRGQTHTTAGSALNSGVRAATHDFVAFVHQDVHLHSLEALERAAGLLADRPDLGLLGAVGVTSGGEVVGRTRDRVVLLGRPADEPVAVDSLDEVLFLARRRDLLAEPIAEHVDLAWHAYAVELGMRVRAGGRLVAAVDIPLTHNSLSTNLARLDHAHAVLATMYPEQVPTRTTCGNVTSSVPRSEAAPFLPDHRWRLRWLQGSWSARQARLATGSRQVVLADMRTDVDRVLARSGIARLRVLNLRPSDTALPEPPEGTRLRRGDVDLVCRNVGPEELAGLSLADRPTLVTNLHVSDLARLPVGPDDVVGVHEELGYWLLTGVDLDADDIWCSPRTRPWRLLV